MKKLCLIFNTPSLYRQRIYCKIDEKYDCDWYFEESDSDLKRMDLSLLHNVTLLKTKGDPTKYYWQPGLTRIIGKKEYQYFFMVAATRSISFWIFMLKAKLFYPEKKIFIWTHGMYGKESRIELLMKRWLYLHVDGTFVYGNYAKQLMTKAGCPEDKIFVIHNSLNYETQLTLRDLSIPSDIYFKHFGNSNKNIIFIGRLTEVKRLDLLINAISELKEGGESYNLTLVGNGVKRTELANLSNDAGLQDNIWFYGECYDEKINAELIYNSDLCVSPGNVGLTAIHSLMFGTPVITHNCFKRQMPEFESIIPEMTGDFFEYNNLRSLTRVISKWFRTNDNKREYVRLNCFKEIDSNWTPYHQMNILNKHLKF